jgi:hypothetical protein
MWRSTDIVENNDARQHMAILLKISCPVTLNDLHDCKRYGEQTQKEIKRWYIEVRFDI